MKVLDELQSNTEQIGNDFVERAAEVTDKDNNLFVTYDDYIKAGVYLKVAKEAYSASVNLERPENTIYLETQYSSVFKNHAMNAVLEALEALEALEVLGADY